MPWPNQVDAERARQHVRALLDGGMTITQIQFASGVNRTAIRVLIGDFPNRKPSRQIRADTDRQLLATQLDRGSTIDGLVPSIGSRRRLLALVAIGYPLRWLAKQLGAPDSVHCVQVGRNQLMRAANAKAIAALYEQLRDLPGPSSRAREYALLRGWLGPLWWDDDTIDDPLHVPDGLASYRVRGVPVADDVDEVAVERAVLGDPPPTITAAELDAAIEYMHEHGMSDAQIGDRLNMTGEAVLKRRRRRDDQRTAVPVLVDDVTLPRPERVRLLRQRGLEPHEIAERIGTRVRYVHRDLLGGRQLTRLEEAK